MTLTNIVVLTCFTQIVTHLEQQFMTPPLIPLLGYIKLKHFWSQPVAEILVEIKACVQRALVIVDVTFHVQGFKSLEWGIPCPEKYTDVFDYVLGTDRTEVTFKQRSFYATLL